MRLQLTLSVPDGASYSVRCPNAAWRSPADRRRPRSGRSLRWAGVAHG